MAKKQIIILALIVCVPLGLLAWLGARFAREEQTAVRQQFREVLTGKLKDADQTVVHFFDDRERDLLQLTELDSVETSKLRDLIRTTRGIDQLFVLDAEGALIHPDLDGPLNQFERDFLTQNREILDDKDLVLASGESDQPRTRTSEISNVRLSNGSKVLPSSKSHGWLVWYWGRGLNLIFWRRLDSGDVVGVTLTRSPWISDLIEDLPETDQEEDPDGPQARVVLVDSNGNSVHQWGHFEPPASAQPFVEVPVSAPLSSWRLQYFVDDEEFVTSSGRSAYFNLYAALIVVGLGLVGLTAYFGREYAREVREAKQRVNFVNQVSHELKTPLTNIRMYADLLEYDVQSLDSPDGDKLQERLNVIVSESQRLSRLIGNVLTFAGQQRQTTKLHNKSANIDQVIAAVVDRLRPSLAQKGIEVSLEMQAHDAVEVDVDALEQILVNLLSNVEKYAATGKRADIVSRHQGDRTFIEIADQGPGVPREHREKIFRPFHRVSDRIEGVAGTGIGLTIAHKLARLHGGDLTLLESPSGAKFQVELLTPRVKS